MKHRFPLLIKLCIVGAFILLPDTVFAQEMDSVQQTAQKLGEYLDFLSWLWIIPAVVAGKLMTNDFVYGEFIGLTEVLWQLWQAMKVFSYITLGFVFLAMILSHFFKQDDPGKLGDTIKKTFVAGILIQMSWFLMAVLIDLSVVLTAAVGAIPLQVMEPQWNQLQNQFKVKEIVIDADTGKQVNEANTSTGGAILTLDNVMPDYDTVGGSLVFLAAGVMRLSEIHFVGDTNADQGAENINYEGIIIASGIKLLVVLMFSVPMLVLMIINAVRIFWIWIWILFSPFIILDVVFNGPLQKSEQGDKFKISTIFGLVFQPVVIVGLLALGMIMIVGILDALLGGEDYRRGSLESMQIYIESDTTTRIGNGPNAEAIITGDLIKDVGGHVGGFVGQMVISLFSIFLLWSLVKAGASFSAVTKEIADKGFKFAEGSMKAIPLPGIGSIASGGKALEQIQSKSTNFMNEKNQKQADDSLKGVYKAFGLDKDKDKIDGNMTVSQQSEVMSALSGGYNPGDKTKKFWNKMHEHTSSAKKGEGFMYRGNTQKAIEKWFDEAGRAYLGLEDKDTIENNGSARGFIDRMMKEGGQNASSYKSSSVTSSAFTNSTEWHKDGRTN